MVDVADVPTIMTPVPPRRASVKSSSVLAAHRCQRAVLDAFDDGNWQARTVDSATTNARESRGFDTSKTRRRDLRVGSAPEPDSLAQSHTRNTETI